MAGLIQADSPLAAQLSSVVQPKLMEIGWATGGPDDSALAEYIILMLINGKSQEQIASELSNDLLSLGPDDPGATNFAIWLFEQVNLLLKPSAASQQAAPVASAADTQAIPSFTSDVHDDQPAQDAEMGEATDGVADTNIPTGPKSMRNAKPNGKRLVGQLNKAMDRSKDRSKDRSSDAVLHRVRPQGQERINSHNRQPPKGPRANVGPNRFNQNAQVGPPRGPGGGRGQHGGMTGGMAMSAQQQAQIMQFMEQQAKLMSTILTPQQQQQMNFGGMPAPAINPNFRPQGKSLFDRVQHKPNGPGQSRFHNNGNGYQGKKQDTEMGGDTTMDVEGSQTSSELGPNTICKYNLKCTKSDCIFAHQSPAAPPGSAVDVADSCPFGAACKNRKCVGRHPSPAGKVAHQSEQDCKFFPNCTNPNCTFRHPSTPICRFGADCTREDCKFTHVQTKCKFNPCLNPSCAFKHEEGQKRGKFGDMVWTAEGAKEHVSDRKFVATTDDQEELIIPGAAEAGESQSSHAAVEIAT